MQKMVILPFILLGILFNICLIASDLLGTKVVQADGIAATAGLIVFPTSYIINGYIVRTWGFKKARLITWGGFASNLLVIVLTQLVILLPVTPFWEGGEGFNLVFRMAPRITVTSLIAFLAGPFLNAHMMNKMKIVSNGKNFSLRVIVPTLIDESADSLTFFPIASAGLILAGELLIMVGMQTVPKSSYEVIVFLAIIHVVKYIKKVDGNDVYDLGISYSILKVKDT